jgi:DNA-binding HxlR family transcriptional regulator
VEYELSELGTGVAVFMEGIRRWSEEHVTEILSSRDAYDARAAREPLPIRMN